MSATLFFTISGTTGDHADVSRLVGCEPNKIHHRHPVVADRPDFPDWEWTLIEAFSDGEDVDAAVNRFIATRIGPISRFAADIERSGWECSLLFAPVAPTRGLYLTKESIAIIAQLKVDLGVDPEP